MKFIRIFLFVFIEFLLLFGTIASGRASTNTTYQAVGIYDKKGGIVALDTAEEAEESGDGLTDTLCTLIVFLQGRTGRVIAATAIFAFGIGFFLNKVSWTQLVILVIGLSFLFGAETIALSFLPVYTYYTDPDAPQFGTQARPTEAVVRQACQELAGSM